MQKMSIFTFGSAKKTLSDCKLVQVAMETMDGEIELHFLTTPIICEPLPAQPIALCINSYEHLLELRLADSSDGNATMEVDLLVGSDYYWELTTGRVSRGEDGAVETKLGWVGFCQAQSQQPMSHTLRVDATMLSYYYH